MSDGTACLLVREMAASPVDLVPVEILDALHIITNALVMAILWLLVDSTIMQVTGKEVSTICPLIPRVHKQFAILLEFLGRYLHRVILLK